MLKFQFAKISKFSGNFKYARAHMLIGRYAPEEEWLTEYKELDSKGERHSTHLMILEKAAGIKI